MDFLFCHKDETEKTIKFPTFWDFLDKKDKHIAGVDFIIWIDSKNYEYCFDIMKNKIHFKKVGAPKFKTWPDYEAFKKPVEICEDELDDL